MRNKLKFVLLIWPIVLLLGMWCTAFYQQHQIDKKLLNADGLVWKAGEEQFEAQVKEYEDGELLHIKIVVVNSEKEEVYNKIEVIDRDMFGGGFVRAVQVDRDSENEIVVWHSKAKYYLDFAEGHVREVTFDRVPQQVKGLAKSWHKYNVMAGLEMSILLIFVFCYYSLYILVMGFLRLIKRKRNRK